MTDHFIEIDLCQACAVNRHDEELEHPPYEEQDPPVKCFNCKVELTKDDN